MYLGNPDWSANLVEALTNGGITLKEKISQTPGGKDIFGCQKNVFLKS